MKRGFNTILVSSILLLGLTGATNAMDAPNAEAATAPLSNRPNVLLISIDSLRADHVGAYGYGPPTTPVIDRLAAAGAVFTQALSTTSWTLPSHIAMLTGLYDRAHGVTVPTRTLGDAIPTLAESFSSAGYRTVGLYSGPFLHPQFGLSRGFDEYVDCTSFRMGSKEALTPGKSHNDSHKDVTNPYVTWNFLETLNRAGKKPQFYFVHLWDVHYDLIPPPPFDTMFDPDYDAQYSGHNFRHDPKFKTGMPAKDRKHVLALYDGEIRYTDTTIGLLLSAFKSAGRLDNTIVVITADHGEEFLEHGRKGHKQTLYQEVLKVPLIISWPGKIAPERIDTPVSIVDIAPSLLSLIDAPPLPASSGRALFGEAGVPAGREARPILSELFNLPGKAALSAIVYKDRKLLVSAKKGTEPVYFDLREDPEELLPQPIAEAAEHRDMMEALDREISRAQRQAGATPTPGRSRDHELTEDLSERLRSLGYLE
jgi:arylsulfatase A-like enzyme